MGTAKARGVFLAGLLACSPLYGFSQGQDPVEAVQPPPASEFAKDLKTAWEALRAGQKIALPVEMAARTWAFRRDDQAVVYVSLEIPGGPQPAMPNPAQIAVRCELSTGSEEPPGSFEAHLQTSQDTEEPLRMVEWLTAPFGDYHVECLARETPSGRLGHVSITGSTAHLAPGQELVSSDLVLTQEVGKVEAAQGPGPLSRQGVTLVPPTRLVFDRQKPVLVYFETYNLGAGTVPGSVVYDYRIFQAEAMFFASPLAPLEWKPGAKWADQTLKLDLSALQPGSYALLLKVFDTGQGKATFKRTEFELR